MPAALLGLVVLVLLVSALRVVIKTDPKRLVRTAKVAGIALIVVSILLASRGLVAVAVPLGILGVGLLALVPREPVQSRSQVSRVRSAFVEMELDHDSGRVSGRIVAGARAGASLDDLDVATLISLMEGFDADSQALIASYLDRRDPAWREHAQADPAAGQPRPSSGPMSEQEAYEILGLKPGASAEDIGRAHRDLMQKFHPDHRGTSRLAALINEAKDVLLRRHRRYS